MILSLTMNQKEIEMKEYTIAGQAQSDWTIAEILHIAADDFLAVKKSEYRYHGGNKEKFSCCAVKEAVYALYGYFDVETYALIERIYQGLENMGCPTGSSYAFNNNGRFVQESQQARYAWLKFAAMMAEEQGV